MRSLILSLSCALALTPLVGTSSAATGPGTVEASVASGARFHHTQRHLVFNHRRITFSFALAGGYDEDGYRFCSIELENNRTGDTVDYTYIEDGNDYGRMRLNIDDATYSGGAGKHTVVADCSNGAFAERTVWMRSASKVNAGWAVGEGRAVGAAVDVQRFSNGGYEPARNTAVSLQRWVRSAWRPVRRQKTNRHGVVFMPVRTTRGRWRVVVVRTYKTERSAAIVRTGGINAG